MATDTASRVTLYTSHLTSTSVVATPLSPSPCLCASKILFASSKYLRNLLPTNSTSSNLHTLPKSPGQKAITNTTTRFTNRPKIDYWTDLLGVETIEKFKDLARDFAEQDSVEDIVNWDKYLLEQLGNEHFVDQYNVWSKEHFAPRPRVNLTVWSGSRTHELRRRLQDANWNVSNPSLKAVSSMMLYGRRLDNDGLFSLGSFQTFWLILRLNMWAISPQNTSPELRQRYGVADAQPGGVLGLRYKLMDDESTKKVLLFFPLGKSVSSASLLVGWLIDRHRIYPLHWSPRERYDFGR